MGTLVNFLLLMCGVFALTAGLYYFIGEKNNPLLSKSMLVLGCFVFVWCGGYSLMGFAEEIHMAYTGRNIGFVGILGFLYAEVIYITKASGAFPHWRKVIAFIVFLFTALDAIFFSQANAFTFVRIDNRTCFYAKPAFGRGFHSLFLVFVLIYLCFLGVFWLRNSKLKRVRMLILTLFVANIIVLLCAIPDLILPLLNKPSFPISGFGGFFAFIFWWRYNTKVNTFRISLPQLSGYLYNDVHMSMLVFNHKYKLVLANDYAKKTLGIENDDELLSDVFTIDKNDAVTMFGSVSADREKTFYKLVPRNKDILCSVNFSVITDPYNDVYCYICFVYDLSEEMEALNFAHKQKEELQATLQGKAEQVEHITLQSIATIANTIDAKDAYTKGHSGRVAEYSAKLAAKIGWTDSEIQNLKYIALLHDIGKIGVPDSVLNKPSKLTDEEYDVIKAHTVVGGDILKDITIIKDLSAGAKYHHERYDGKGYYHGMKGEEIPLIARIIAIADAYDAMSSKRIYRDSLTEKEIREQLVEGRGTQFDPHLLDVFLEMFDEKELNLNPDYESHLQIMVDESSKILSQIMANMEEEWKKESQTDYVTQLLNRKAGEEKIIQAMKAAPGCLALIDLDNLKTINDTFGHLSGDFAIRTVADVLSNYKEDTIAARAGGDEFLFYIKNVSRPEVTVLINEIIHNFRLKKDRAGEIHMASISVGLCMTKQDDAYKDVYKNADKALYYVKQNGKDGYAFFSETAQGTEKAEHGDLKRIAESILRQGRYDGTFGLEYREFTKLCNFINNMAMRYQQKLQLLMVTLDSGKTESEFGDKCEQAMSYLEEAIKITLRNVDVTTRFSKEQFLVILTNANISNVEMIMDRIKEEFYKKITEADMTLHYDVIDLFNLEEAAGA